MMAADLDPRWHGAIIPDGHWQFHRTIFKLYGLVLEPGELSMMLHDVKSGRAPMVVDLGVNGCIHAVRVRSVGAWVFAFVVAGAMRTILPPARPLRDARRRVLALAAE
jgi:hypothetical protein